MTKKKGMRRNRGGRRNPTPPPLSGIPSVAQLEREMYGAELAMVVAAQYANRWRHY